MSKHTCECRDPGCPKCGGTCSERAKQALLRVDMEDKTGTLFCDGCAEDALESGLFRRSIRAWITRTRKN